MKFDTILHEDLVFVQKDFSNAKEVISFLAEQLLKRGYVKERFSHAVLEREEKFPTSLYLGSINVAIPHADIKYVNKPGMAVVTLQKPVSFGKMDDPKKKIPVHIVFLLAVQDSKGYVKFLSKLTSSFSNKLFLQSLYSERNSAKAAELLRKVLILKPEARARS